MKYLLVLFFLYNTVFAGCSSSYNPVINYVNNSPGTYYLNFQTPVTCSSTYSGIMIYNNYTSDAITVTNGSNQIIVQFGQNSSTPSCSGCSSTLVGGLLTSGTSWNIFATFLVKSGQNPPPGTYTGNINLWLVSSNPTLNSQTATYNMTVNVAGTCSLSTSGINFGTISSAGVDSSPGTITANCTSGLAYTISASSGNNTISARTMMKNSEKIYYNLYLDANNYGTILGDGSTGITTSLIGTGANQTINIYGKIPPNQLPSPGTYTDSINIIITY